MPEKRSCQPGSTPINQEGKGAFQPTPHADQVEEWLLSQKPDSNNPRRYEEDDDSHLGLS